MLHHWLTHFTSQRQDAVVTNFYPLCETLCSLCLCTEKTLPISPYFFEKCNNFPIFAFYFLCS